MNRKKRGKKNKSPGALYDALKEEKKLLARIDALADPLCESEGLELIHLEYQREARGRVLRLYIDGPDGVTLDDCVNISRQIGDILDVAIEDMGPYYLEVSSPGEKRPLSKTRDFIKFMGKMAEIRTIRQIDGRKKFKGILGNASKEGIDLLINDKTVSIPFEEITKARLVKYDGEN